MDGIKENTIDAFCCAMDSGADGVELDVHLSRDGHLVVSHDSTLFRLYGVKDRICDLSLDLIKEIASDIATLPEVFEVLGPVFYDIEIKADPVTDTKVSDILYSTLKAFPDVQRKVMVSSFNPLAMRRFSSISRHKYPSAIIYDKEKTTPFYLRRGQGRLFFDCDFLNPKADIASNEMDKHTSYRFAPWDVNTLSDAEIFVKKRCPCAHYRRCHAFKGFIMMPRIFLLPLQDDCGSEASEDKPFRIYHILCSLMRALGLL